MRPSRGEARHVAALWTCACLLVPGGLRAQAVRGHLAEQVDAVFAEYDRTDHPGASVVVVRDGRVIHMDGYGMADLDQAIAVTGSSVFDIASVSKHFTAFAITTLAQRGLLSLDDPIDRWMPEIPTHGQRVTVRHLLHHVSGIRDWVELFAVAGWRFDDVITVPDIFILAENQAALNFAPGSAYAYSNTGYNILAEIVARASDASFRDWMQREVFGPLGMSHTHIHDTYNEVVPRRARSYGPDGSGDWEILVNNTSAVGSSSVFTTAEDFAKWLANFDHPEVGGDVLTRMLTRGVLTTGDTIPYASGLGIGSYRGLRTISHGGSWRGYRSHLLRFPDEKLAVAVFANFSTFRSGETAQRVADVFLEGRIEPLADEEGGANGSISFFEERDPEPTPISGDALRKYEGTYFSDELGTFYSIAREDDGLAAHHRINPSSTMTYVGEDTFVMPGVRGRQTLSFFREGDQVVGYRLAGRRFRGIVFRRVPEG